MGLCLPTALYAAIVPGVILAMGIGFAIGRVWERCLGRQALEQGEREDGG